MFGLCQEQLKLVSSRMTRVWFVSGGGAVEVGGGSAQDAGEETEVGRRRKETIEARPGSDSQQEERTTATLVLARQ